MEIEQIFKMMHIVEITQVTIFYMRIYMQSSKGLPNITHQPLLEFLIKTHDNQYIMYVGNPNKTSHLYFSNFQI
jgi:hypothetical protein